MVPKLLVQVSSVAPAPIATVPLPSRLAPVFKLLGLTRRVPALTVVPPLYVLKPLMVIRPVPVLTRLAAFNTPVSFVRAIVTSRPPVPVTLKVVVGAS